MRHDVLREPNRPAGPQPKLITDWVDANAKRDPHGTALALPDIEVSHADFCAATLLAARRLRAAGVRAGEHVGLLLSTEVLDYLAYSYGAARLGAVAVCINARFKVRELKFAVENSGLKLLLTSRWFAPIIEASDLSDTCRTVDITVGGRFRDGAIDVSAAKVHEQTAKVRGEHPVRVIYTSGGTSMPKGCLHTHDALIAQGEAVATALSLTPLDRFWTPLPMFHTGGWTPFLATQARGAALHHCLRFEASPALRQIVDQRCTVLFPGFETIWLAVLDDPNFSVEALSAARLITIVGAPERLRVMQSRCPDVTQISNYGSTECGGFLCLGDSSDSFDSRMTTAGRLVDGMEARIIDPASGADLPAGNEGELLVRGTALFSEYFGDPAATADVIDGGGWFHTGDLLTRGEDGGYRYVGRVKDMLKVGGENVAAAEIEDHLLTHPAVFLVAVVSAPDTKYGEVPAAYVQLKPGAQATENELVLHCTGTIASFKVPRYVRFVDEWPMSGTTINKVQLRERIAADLIRADAEGLSVQNG